MVTDTKEIVVFFPETIFWCCPNISHWFPAPWEQCYYYSNCCYPRDKWRGCLYFLFPKYWWCWEQYKWTAGWWNDFSRAVSHSLLRIIIQRDCVLIFSWNICWMHLFWNLRVLFKKHKERWQLGPRWRTRCVREITGRYCTCPKCNASNILWQHQVTILFNDAPKS